ncbi:hypothetical protein, partial [Bacillus mycoides]|uniref:hypothetical protein n=1 Tax=Bacillus mycoides TaxID=1405 RepID=UPI003A80DD37
KSIPFKQPTVNLNDILNPNGNTVKQEVEKPIVQKPVAAVIEKPVEPNQVSKKGVESKQVAVKVIEEKPVVVKDDEPKQETAPAGTVKVAYDSPQITRNEEPQETVEQYILNHGTKVGMFTYSIPKEVLQSLYTKKKIDKALNMTLIFDDGDVYSAEK